jgi:hypothetical protein
LIGGLVIATVSVIVAHGLTGGRSAIDQIVTSRRGQHRNADLGEAVVIGPIKVALFRLRVSREDTVVFLQYFREQIFELRGAAADDYEVAGASFG